jgi:hypothetical protein
MKSKKNIIIIALAVLIIARIVIILIENKKIANESTSSIIPGSVSIVTPDLNPDANLSKTPSEAVTSQNNTTQSDLCQSMRAHYQNLTEIRKVEKASTRFVNIHKKVDGVTYRTRFFYKDSSENEIPTYLLYREDQNEEPILVETSPYKKGPKYSEIEKADGMVIYTEEGVNIGIDQDLFLHYENKQLKDLQGISPLREEKDFIECRF